MAITGQAKRRRIVINADAYISGATSNFPVLVKFNSTSHPDLFATGDDKDSVWFSSDASGQTTLYHEGVVFSATDAIFYVKVDLSSTADTVIYFWYGTPSITGTESKTNVWTNAVTIAHYVTDETNPTATVGTDGTKTNATFTASGRAVGGAYTTASNGYITHGTITPMSISVIFWIKKNGCSNNYTKIIGELFESGGNVSGWEVDIPAASTGYVRFGRLSGADWTTWKSATVSTSIKDNVWHLVAGTYDGTNIKCNIDGGTQASTSATGNIVYNYGSTLYVGRSGINSGTNEEETFDNIWVFSDAKSLDWIKAVYNNVQNYSTFITIDGSVSIGSSPKMVVPVWPTTTQEDYSESVSCGIGVSAAVAKQTDYHRAVTCGIGVAAAVTKQVDYLRSISCGIGISVEVTAQRNVPKSINCGIGVAATVSTQTDYSRTVSCGIGVAATVLKSSGLESAINCGIGVSADVSTQANYSRSINCGIGVAIGKKEELTTSINCSIGIAATVSTQIGYNRSISCGIGVAAAVSTQTNYARTINCGIGVGISTDAANVEVIEVGVGISAAVTTQANYSRTVNCGIGVAAAVGRVQELTQAISCGVGVAASVSKQANFHRSVSCGIGVAIGTQKEIGKTISCGIGVSATVTYQVYTDQDNFNIEKITVSKNIQDAMWQSTIQIDGTTVPPYYRHLRLYMKDHTDTDQLVFVGFLPSADYTLVAAGNKTTMTAYDYGWYLSSQYVPNSLRITDEDTNPADTIKAILGGSTWEKETGIEPYKIDDVSGWGTTVTKKSFVFDKKTTKKQAIDEICSHCNFIFVLKWRITSGGHSRPCAYFINEDDIDTDLDLPSKATFASGNAYLLGNVKVEDRQNEKINRVRVAGANPITGDWYEAVVESVGVTSGDEIPIEYYFESSSLDTQEKVDDKAQALFDFFNTVAKTYTATLLNRTDLRLYQKIQFTGYSKIDSDEMRIIGISYADLGTHREVTVQFTSDQSLSDLKALNRSMGGDIYNNTTNILNHYFIDLTKIAVGTITAIDGNTATVELEDGSGFVKARLINQNE